MGRRSQRIYVFDRVAFVQRGGDGLWLRSHVCITVVACDHCHAAINEPCRSTTNANNGEPVGYTHYVRRRAANEAVRKMKSKTMIIIIGSNK